MRSGFTLLEVMIALAIFAATALAVVTVTTGHLNSLSVLHEKMVAGWVADNQVALLYISSDELRNKQKRGEVKMAGEIWYWRSIPVETGTPLLQCVDIEVSAHSTFQTVSASRRAYFIPPNVERSLG